MGEAKRRAVSRKQQEEQLGKVDVSRLAASVRHVMATVSGCPGQDCLMHARLGHAILAELDINTKIAIGAASWRVGKGDSDVIANDPRSLIPGQESGYPYHAWIECGQYILDLTTYHLRFNAARLDKLDGGATSVDWCPDFLFVKRETISSWEEVALHEHSGAYNYQRIEGLGFMISSMPDHVGYLVQLALAIYRVSGSATTYYSNAA